MSVAHLPIGRGGEDNKIIYLILNIEHEGK
jgi:hypothetical protein